MSSAGHVCTRGTSCPLCTQGCPRGTSVCRIFLEWDGLYRRKLRLSGQPCAQRPHSCQVENLGLRPRSTNPRANACQPQSARSPGLACFCPTCSQHLPQVRKATESPSRLGSRCLLSAAFLSSLGGQASAGPSRHSQSWHQLRDPRAPSTGLSKEWIRVKGCIDYQPPLSCGFPTT